MGTLPFPVFLRKILLTYKNHGMTRSLAHPSAGSALGRQAGCQRGSGRSWSWELSSAHSTEPQNPFLLPSCSLSPLRWLCLTSSHRAGKEGFKPDTQNPVWVWFRKKKKSIGWVVSCISSRTLPFPPAHGCWVWKLTTTPGLATFHNSLLVGTPPCPQTA